MIQAVIVLSWLALPVLALYFVVRYGWPGKKMDPSMAWHLSLTTVVVGAEAVALLLSSKILWLAAIVYAGSVSIMVWRIVILERQKARERRWRRGRIDPAIEEGE